jgi:hypothetical protein
MILGRENGELAALITILVAAAIMAGIIVYGATNNNTATGPSSTASHPTTTG